jgi:hypothetical protein
MHAAALAGILVVIATAAVARPPMAPEGPFFLHLPNPDGFAYAQHPAQSDVIALERQGPPTAPQSGLSFGPIHAQTVSDPRPGRHKPVMRYDVDGVKLFGGAVGGSVGDHGAMLTLHW